MAEPQTAYASISADTTGRTLREWRRINRIKQEFVAVTLGVSQAAVSRWENGHDIPSPTVLGRIETMMAGFHRDELRLERAIMDIQSSVRSLTRLDGVVLEATSPGFRALWPDFPLFVGRPLHDHLLNESAAFYGSADNRRDLRIGRIAYVRGASLRHLSIGEGERMHLWTACNRRIGGEAFVEFIYEIAPPGTQPGIHEIFTL